MTSMFKKFLKNDKDDGQVSQFSPKSADLQAQDGQQTDTAQKTQEAEPAKKSHGGGFCCGSCS